MGLFDELGGELPFNVTDYDRLPEIFASHSVFHFAGKNGCTRCDLTGWELVVMPCEPPDNWWTNLGSVRI